MLIDTNHKQYVGALIGQSALKRNAAEFDVRILQTAEAVFAQDQARFIRGANVPAAHWRSGEGSIAHAVQT